MSVEDDDVNEDTYIEGFEFIGELHRSEFYGWSAFGVWKRGHQLFAATDYGCSCNYPWMGTPDLSPHTLDEIRQAIRARFKWEGRDAAEAFIRKIEEAV